MNSRFGASRGARGWRDRSTGGSIDQVPYDRSVLLLVDLDGVVYRGRTPVPGVAAVLRDRAAKGDRVIYVTNNSSRHRDEYRAQLRQMDLPMAEESIVTAARATAVTLNERDPRP